MAIESSFPEFFTRSDDHSKAWQRRFFRSQKVQLGAVLAAALAANFGKPGMTCAVVLFVLAGSCNVYLLVTRADQRWWNGRAGAESAKTMAWCYCVGGAPFSKASLDADGELSRRVNEIATKVAQLAAVPVVSSPVTAEMREARSSPLSERISFYLEERIRGQMKWYSEKSTEKERLGRAWTLAAIAAQAGGIAIGVVGLLTDVDFDFVGLFSAAAATAVAWTAVQQYDVLARSYAVASSELSVIDTKIEGTDWTEEDWAVFVNEAEEAISREHTSWRASRAV